MTHSIQYENFKHEPLDQTKHSFRLIRVRGLSQDGLVDCTVSTHSCDDDATRSYSALSYTWGPEQPCGWIRLNSQRFRVRRNLLDFLEVAVASHQAACENIFIDALCINQEDMLERNHQVMQMADIYRNAATVFVWLGQPHGEYDELAAALKRIDDDSLKDADGFKLRLRREFQDHFGDDSRPVNRQLVDLLSRDYWGRMWIVQEVILGRDKVRLLCGTYSFQWTTMQRLVTVELGAGSADGKGLALEAWCEKHMGRALEISETARTHWGEGIISEKPTLIQLLQLLQGGGMCAEPLDKVYALLGLVQDSGALKEGTLDADYSISLETLFFRVLRAESESTVTDQVLLKDAICLAEYLGLTFPRLSDYLKTPEGQSYREEPIWLGIKHSYAPGIINIPTALKSRWFSELWAPCRAAGDQVYQFDHDRSMSATELQILPFDIAFEFAYSWPDEDVRKAVVLRRTKEGTFSYAAMAEYPADHVKHRRCFLYHLPALHGAGPFTAKPKNLPKRLSVPPPAFVALMVLFQINMSIADPRVSKEVLELLGIRDGFVITHSSLVVHRSLPDVANYEAMDHDIKSVRGKDCQEVYDGYSELLRAQTGGH
ncbi:hypothetical protein BFW01_g7590 [Lasiodiplodia theobromae]|nr:hypothetical protein BFW01_g7590 [Lasiodiplodia theobromae]